MTRLMMMLLMICLSSCNSYQIFCDVSFEENRCLCRCLSIKTLKNAPRVKCEDDWNEYFGGVPEDHPIRFPVNYCEGIGGFRVEEIAKDIIPGVKRERARCEDLEVMNANTF